MTTTHAIPLSETAGHDVAAPQRIASATSAVKPERSIGSILTLAIVVTSLFFFVVTGAVVWAVSGDWLFGLGMGLFCGCWGGPGFGAMVGGTVWHLQETAGDDSGSH